MTSEQIKQWKQSRDIARAISDEGSRKIALEKVYDQRDDLQMECIQHQADRIKKCLAKSESMEKDIANIKCEIAPLKETCTEYNVLKERSKVAMWGARISIAVVAVVGFETAKGLFDVLSGLIK